MRHDRTIEIHSTISVSELINAVQTVPEEILRFIIADGVAVAEMERVNELWAQAKAKRKHLVFYTNDPELVEVLSRQGFLVKPKDTFQAKRDYYRTLAEGSLLDKKISDIVVAKKASDIEAPIKRVAQPKPQRPASRLKSKASTKQTVIADTEVISESTTGPEFTEFTGDKEPAMSWLARVRSFFTRRESQGRSRKFYLIIFVVLVAALLILVSTFVLASAEVTVTAKREMIPIELKAKADTKMQKVDQASLFIPAQFFELERSATAPFKATGQATIQQKARGTLTIFNNYSSLAQPLVFGTRFKEPGGKIYRLSRGITVPGAKIEEGKIVASSIKAEVEADQAGPDYNIGPTTFVIPGFEGTPKFNGFSAKSEQAMAGGASGVVPEVTAQDLTNFAQQLQDAMFNQLEEALKAQLPKGVVLLDQAKTRKVDTLTFTAKAGQRVADFEGKIKATLSVLVFKEEDVMSLVNQRLSGSLTLDKKLEKTATMNYIAAVFDPGKETLVFTAKTEATLVWNVSKQEILRRVKGKSETEIKNILRQVSAVQKAKVSFWPFWRDSAPNKESRIKIVIE